MSKCNGFRINSLKNKIIALMLVFLAMFQIRAFALVEGPESPGGPGETVSQSKENSGTTNKTVIQSKEESAGATNEPTNQSNLDVVSEAPSNHHHHFSKDIARNVINDVVKIAKFIMSCFAITFSVWGLMYAFHATDKPPTGWWSSAWRF